MKVGDYVRTKKGIAKIIDRINDPTNYYDKFWVCDRHLELNDDTEYIHEQDIIGEPKGRIIDLIEVGDYVNGTIVTKVVLDEIECKYIELDYTYNKIGIREKDIKSIVTKEQFKSIEYEVE